MNVAHILLILLPLLLPQQRTKVDEILATVNGKAVTRGDVEAILALSRTPVTRRELLVQLIQRRILEQKAQAASVRVPDEQLTETMAARIDRLGGNETYQEALKALDRSVDQDRLDVRNQLMADRFVDHCLGRVAGSPHLRPHLSRTTFVTPGEVQQHYRDNRERFRTEPGIEVGRLLVAKAHFPTPEKAKEHAELLRKQALRIFSGDLEKVIQEGDRARFGRMSLRSRQESGLIPEIRTFLDAAPVGVLSPVLETGGAYVVVVKLAEEPGRALSFDEVQDSVFALLTQLKWQRARQQLALELLQEAEVWPENLIPQTSPSPSEIAPRGSGS